MHAVIAAAHDALRTAAQWLTHHDGVCWAGICFLITIAVISVIDGEH